MAIKMTKEEEILYNRKRKLEVRYSTRSCFCRLCAKTVPANSELMASFYNSSGKGGQDFICFDCVTFMYKSIQGA